MTRKFFSIMLYLSIILLIPILGFAKQPEVNWSVFNNSPLIKLDYDEWDDSGEFTFDFPKSSIKANVYNFGDISLIGVIENGVPHFVLAGYTSYMFGDNSIKSAIIRTDDRRYSFDFQATRDGNRTAIGLLPIGNEGMEMLKDMAASSKVEIRLSGRRSNVGSLDDFDYNEQFVVDPIQTEFIGTIIEVYLEACKNLPRTYLDSFDGIISIK